jgi:hypothetical protein
MTYRNLKIAVAGLALVMSTNAFAKHEPQPGDNRGGKGRPFHLAKGQAEPGDDRGNKGAQPNDDRGRNKGRPFHLAKGQPEPGDKRGGKGLPLA